MGALPLCSSRLFPQSLSRLVCRVSPRQASSFLWRKESYQRNMPDSSPCYARFPARLRSSWGFCDSASLHSHKRLRRPCLAPSFHCGLLTQLPLRCSARQTGGKVNGTLRARKVPSFPRRRGSSYRSTFPKSLDSRLRGNDGKIEKAEATHIG